MRNLCLALLLSLAAAAGEYVLPQLPEGLEAKVVAQAPEVANPASVAVSPDGRSVYIGTRWTDNKDGKDRVYLAQDTKGDGSYGRLSSIAEGHSSTQGLLCVGDTLYLLHAPLLTALRGLDANGKARETKDLLTGLLTGPKSDKWLPKQLAARLALGADGWLYIALGDWGVYKGKGADGKTFQLRGGGIIRVQPDGTDVEVYCQGLRNMVALAVDPELNIFVRDNSNDGSGLGARSLHILQGADYGYPNLFRNYPEETLPAMQEHSGGLPGAALFYAESGLREEDREKLFVADWGRGTIYRCSLVRKGAGFELRQDEWLKPQFPFRPVDMATDAFGNLYLADWGHSTSGRPEAAGAVVRIALKNAPPRAPLGDFKTATIAGLAAMLGRAGLTERLTAQQELLARGEAALQELLGILEADREKPRLQKVFALWTYMQIAKAKAAPALLKLAEKPELRAHALRALTDRVGDLEGLRVEPFAKALKDDNPFVRAQAAIGLSRMGVSAPAERAAEIATALGKALSDSEAQVRHLAMRGLRTMQAADECLRIAESGSPAAKESALLALREIHTDQAAEGLLALNARTPEPKAKAELLKCMGRQAFEEDAWSGEPWGPQPDTSGPFQNPVSWSGTKKLAGAVKAGLSDKDERIVAAGLWAWACMRDDSAVDEMTKLAAQGAPKLKALATRALLAARSAQAVGFYKNLLVDSTRPEDERIRALDILRSLRTPAAEQALAEALAALDAEFKGKDYDRNAGLLSRALRTLSGLADRKALPALQSLFKAPTTTTETRLAAARALFSQPPDIAFHTLAVLINDPDPQIVSMAMNNLPPQGPITALNMRPFLLHREIGVQAGALTALGRFKDAESAEAMAQRLANPALQNAAIEALSLLGRCGSEENITRTVETIVGLIENNKFATIRAETDAIACARAWASPPAGSEETRQKLAACVERLKARDEKLSRRRGQFVAGVLAREGDANKGEALFKDAQRLGCARCHVSNEKRETRNEFSLLSSHFSMPAGPDLSSIGALKDKRYLLDSILEPERDIASGFEPAKVTLHSGRRLYGPMFKRTAARFDLAMASGLRDTIPEAEVKEKYPALGTLMPAGLADNLTTEELSDLLAYLMAQKN